MRHVLAGARGPLLSLFAVVFGAAPVAAQIELGPSLGVFWPLGGWTQSVGDQIVERRQLTATLLSARLAYWPGGRLGFEATLGYSPSLVAVTDPTRVQANTRTQDITSGVVLGSARLLAHLGTLRDERRGAFVTDWGFFGGLGVGVVSRRGSAWANHTGTTYPALVATFETRTHLVGPVMLRVMLEDFVAAPTFNAGLPTETRSRIHHDLLVTLMAVVRLGPGGRPQGTTEPPGGPAQP